MGADRLDYQVIRTDYPQYLPLLGAARTVTTGEPALVMDFGGSFVKRARAHYDATGLTNVQILDSLPSDFAANTDTQHVMQRVVDIIVQACQEYRPAKPIRQKLQICIMKEYL